MRREGARGSALLPAVGMLGLLGLIASLSLLSGGADLLLATRSVRERGALLAAEGALAAALGELASPGGGAETLLAAPHGVAALPPRAWRDGAWACVAIVKTLSDAADADADPGTPVVLYDRSFGYADAPRGRGGFPVLQVVATVSGGETRGAALAEVTPVSCAPELTAAWTSGGPLELSGSLVVSGFDGEGGGAEGVPAIRARGAVFLGEGVVVEGRVGEDGRAVEADPGLHVPERALEALHAGPTLPALEALPPPSPGEPLGGVRWARGDWTGSLDGAGILLVHNPDYDPVRHEASRLALEEGIVTEAWDAAYSHLDERRRPAELRPLSGGAFRGVVIADRVASPGLQASVTGALLTLGRSPVRLHAEAPLTVRYSRPAVDGCGRGPLSHLTAWRVLPARREDR